MDINQHSLLDNRITLQVAGVRRREDDTNYEEVNMDMSEVITTHTPYNLVLDSFCQLLPTVLCWTM